MYRIYCTDGEDVTSPEYVFNHEKGEPEYDHETGGFKIAKFETIKEAQQYIHNNALQPKYYYHYSIVKD